MQWKWVEIHLALATVGGYPYNNRRLDDEDGWQRYEEGLPGGADGACYPTMVWLVGLTFVYVRRTCRLLGRCFASEHKARRKKLTVARGTRSAFGLVQVLVVLLLYICGMSAGSRDGHFFGGSSERAHPPNFGEGSTLSAEWHEVFSLSTDTGRAAQTTEEGHFSTSNPNVGAAVFLRCGVSALTNVRTLTFATTVRVGAMTTSSGNFRRLTRGVRIGLGGKYSCILNSTMGFGRRTRGRQPPL